MRAVVLVGGFGTRLRPLTEDIPKPLLPVGQRPIIEHVVRSLAAGGVTEVVLALGFRPDAFSAAYPDGTCDGVPLRYAVEPEPLDTGGAISFAAREAGIDDTFFVVNGDVLTDLDVRALLALPPGAGGAGHDPPHPGRGSVVVRCRRARRRGPRAALRGEAAARCCAQQHDQRRHLRLRAVHDRPRAGRREGLDRAGRVPGCRRREPAVRPVHGRLLDRHRSPRVLPPGQPRRGERASPHRPGAGRGGRARRSTATVDGSVLGAGVEVAAGADVRASVLLSGARVGRGAVVVNSVLGRDAEVGAGAVLDDVVLGSGAIVEAGEHLSNARRPVPA